MNEYDYITSAFTKEGENTNLEVDNLKFSCITSKNNKFEIDSEGNLTVNSINFESLSQQIFDKIYPIGYIYTSIDNTNPSDLFGGEWQPIKDRFLLAAGDIYDAGDMGGEAMHTLTVNEIPSHGHEASTNSTGGHRHTFKGWWTTKGDGSTTYACVARATQNDAEEYGSFSTAGNHSHTVTVNNSGGSQSHNNMPPYLSVYMWRRTN